MLQLTSFFCDVLPARPGDPNYYKAFLTQYTLITVPALFSQAILTPGDYEGGSRESIDADVNEFIQHLPENSQLRRNHYRHYARAAMIDPGYMIQDKEERTFISGFFEKRAEEINRSNRELILSSLNASAYLSYFGLLEDTLSRLHWIVSGRPTGGDKVSAAETMSTNLKGILEGKNITELFVGHLAERSNFFANFDTLSNTWSLLNLIRNRLVHHGGYYSPAYGKRFDENVENIFRTFNDDEYVLERVFFHDRFGPMVEEVQNTKRLTFCDTLENCIRNLSVFVMESLVLSEREIRHKHKPRRV